MFGAVAVPQLLLLLLLGGENILRVKGYGLYSGGFQRGLSMMPQNPPQQPEPQHPPKRETSPLGVPTVGMGKDQVFEVLLSDFKIYSFL